MQVIDQTCKIGLFFFFLPTSQCICENHHRMSLNDGVNRSHRTWEELLTAAMLVAGIETAPLRMWAQRSVSDLTSLGFPVCASPGFRQPAHDPSVGVDSRTRVLQLLPQPFRL